MEEQTNMSDEERAKARVEKSPLRVFIESEKEVKLELPKDGSGVQCVT